jgi:uncharacterized coiled-coil DUF342 family protein
MDNRKKVDKMSDKKIDELKENINQLNSTVEKLDTNVGRVADGIDGLIKALKVLIDEIRIKGL